LVSKEKNRTVEYGLDITGTYPIRSGGTYYAAIGWYGEKYVGINGKTNKLAKVVMEQAPSDSKNLTAGEKWDMGDGYTLTVVSIEPISRLVSFELNKSGIRIDSRVIEAARPDGTGTQGVYTVFNNIGDESNVPIFVTYLDNISTGPDTVSLKYTWLIDTNITEIKASDMYGIFKVITETPLLVLKSDFSVPLSKNSVVTLSGNMKFRVSDSYNDVRFYPFMIKTMDGSLPLVEIIYPTNNSTFLQGEMVSFSGSVIGDPVSYAWNSNLDGSLGNESKLLYSSLSPGTHVITLTVKDSNNLVNSTSRTIKVLPSALSNISGEPASGPMNWDTFNFPGFWYNPETNQSTELLKVVDMKDNRTIDKGKLWYYTALAPMKFKVSSEKNRNVEYALDATGANSVSTGDQYYDVVGWLGNKYVGINGKNNKLSRLILEQPVTDKKILKTGETWDMGNGYTLTAQSIDAESMPRLAWIVLSKDGAKLDDKVIDAARSDIAFNTTQGVYTFYTDIAGETNVPLFVTCIDQILPESIQLKYTWLISDNILEIHAGDKIGLMMVDMENPFVAMKNNEPISLKQDSTVVLLGGLHLKVTNYPDILYYPEMTLFTETNLFPISISVSPSSATLNVSEAYTFNATVLNGSTPVSNVNISWTVSNGSVGSVTPLFSTTGPDGNATVTFTASGAGITSVIATNGSVSGSANIIVNALNIIRFSPTTSAVINNEDESRTFSITTNQIVNVSWLINGTEVFNETGVTTSSYINSSAALGTWNVTAVASNNNGTARQTWIWTVTSVPTTGSIAGYKINDTNGNGIWDQGETGLANWEISLTDNQGKTITNTTDNNGNYLFGGLAAGTYTVTEIPQGGWTQTFPSGTHTVVLTAGQQVTGKNFLNQRSEVSVPEFPSLIIPIAGLFSMIFVLLRRRDK
jgi:S-layer protein (TIGR01567 family)